MPRRPGMQRALPGWVAQAVTWALTQLIARPKALALMLATGLAVGTSAAAAPAPATPPLALHPCRLEGLGHDALCGTLRRPLDPARPAGTQFDLQVALLPALARQKRPDPVFFFAGGPGQSAIGLAGTIAQLTTRLGTRRDVVLIDQRGTGHSAPLQCDTPTPQESLARAFDPAHAVAAMQACQRALQALPWGDLRFYTTSLATQDAEAVRAALGVERIDLIGVSYGTRAALDYLRVHPEHVRRVVLDGVAPPDMVLPASSDIDAQAALAATLRDCAAESGCARDHPRLDETWQRLLAALPRTLAAHDPSDGRPVQVTLTRDALMGLLRPALYVPTLGAMLPHAIEEAAAGRIDVLLALSAAQAGNSSPTDLSEGEHFAVVCSEDVPRLGAAAGQGESASATASAGAGAGAGAGASVGAVDGDKAGTNTRTRIVSDVNGRAGATPARLSAQERLYRAVCADWPRGEVEPMFYTVPPSRSPVLLLSGGLDPVTPPRHAARVARALGPQARAVVVAHHGHGVNALACLRDAIFQFIDTAADAQALAVDLSCADHVPRPLAWQPPQPARAAPASNDPHGFGDDVAPAPPGPQADPAPPPVPSAETPAARAPASARGSR